jgi:hypothetical protein
MSPGEQGEGAGGGGGAHAVHGRLGRGKWSFDVIKRVHESVHVDLHALLFWVL